MSSNVVIDLMREALAADPSPFARIVKVCVQDHTAMEEPHVHLMIHTQVPGRARQTRPWAAVGLQRATPRSIGQTIREFATRVNEDDTPVLIHMHEQDSAKETSTEFLELLWSTCHVLTSSEAGALRAQDNSGCPVCLSEMEPGDELLCLPCDGAHTGHWECLKPWLAKSASCPCCRFELPSSSDERAKFDPLIEQTLKNVKKLTGKGEPCPIRAAGASRLTANPRGLEAAALAGVTPTRAISLRNARQGGERVSPSMRLRTGFYNASSSEGASANRAARQMSPTPLLRYPTGSPAIHSTSVMTSPATVTREARTVSRVPQQRTPVLPSIMGILTGTRRKLPRIRDKP